MAAGGLDSAAMGAPLAPTRWDEFCKKYLTMKQSIAKTK
jgi:hypothetical protein